MIPEGFLYSEGGDIHMKQMGYLRAYMPWQSEFDHRFAAWALNHRGWAKAKKSNKRLAKKREKRSWEKEVYTFAGE